jgi:hypothetical protein
MFETGFPWEARFYMDKKRTTKSLAVLFLFINYSTVTDFARLRGWSTSYPLNTVT